MTKNIKNFFNISSALVLGSLLLWNCEPDVDTLGSQFFTGADAVDAAYPIIAYTINNGDTIRTDASKLDSVVLGAFTEGQFGMQKASYLTQVRLSSFAPKFGTNPVLDSAVISLKPAYYQDSVTTNTVEDYIFNDATNTDVAAKKVVSVYKVKKYGKNIPASAFTIKVNEVNDFMGAASDELRSNKIFATGALLGSKSFDGKISSIAITKDTDASKLYSRDAGIYMKLDSAYFQNKIISKSGTAQLGDVASFIRYFKGLQISVEQNDGYMLKFAPNSLELSLYYKNDETKDNVVTRKAQVFTLDLGSSNTHYSHIAYNRSGTPTENLVADTITGNSRLYLQGMGGPGAGFKIPQTVIDGLKTKFSNDKIGIISAKIRIYNDPVNWDNSYTKPNYFVVRQKDQYSFLTDMATLSFTGKYNLVKTYNLHSKDAFYEIGITQTLKDLVEKDGTKNKDLVINVGGYTYDSTGKLIGSSHPTYANNFNTRSYTPQRGVFVGTVPSGDPNYDKGAKLLITYGQK